MIPAILIARKGSMGFPGKNLAIVNGMAMYKYPAIAANKASLVDELYFFTDYDDREIPPDPSLFIKKARPPELNTSEAQTDDVFMYAYNEIKETRDIEYIVLLFANAVIVTPKMIDTCIFRLSKDADADSICSVSDYNCYNPYRARKKSSTYLVPYVSEEYVKDSDCDRNSTPPCYFYDCCCAVIRPKALTEMRAGMPPQRWLGKKILPYFNHGGVDVDDKFQLGQVEYLLKNGLD